MMELLNHHHRKPELTPQQALQDLISTLPQMPQPMPNQQQQFAMQQQQQQFMQSQQGHPMQQQMSQQGQNPNMMGPGQPPNAAMMIAQQHGNMPPGARTPSGSGGPQFMSPAMANQLLPQMNGSPHLGGPSHTSSPMQGHMQAPGMAHQLSQQGSNPSANTSPNVNNNKRRRSTVKMEGDDGGGPDSTPKVKQSPRVGGGNKRTKNG